MIKKLMILLILVLILYSSSSSLVFAEDYMNNEQLPETIIDFNFSNEPIANVFQSIAKASNINVIVKAEDIDNVTLELDDITVKKAIQLITSTYNLNYIFQDNILIIDTEQNIKDKYSGEHITGPGTGKLIVTDSNKGSGEMVIDKENDEGEKESVSETVKGINKGTLIPARLELGLISSSKKTPALVRVTKTIKYKGETVIPQGAVFTGYGEADYGVRQIFVDLDTLIIGDREIDVKAHMVKDDGTSGFRSEYRDLSMENFLPNLLLSLVSDVIGGTKDVTYIDNGQPVEEKTVKNNLIDRTQEGVKGFQNQVINDAEEHEAIISVDAGVKGYIFIDKKIPLNNFGKKEGEDDEKN